MMRSYVLEMVLPSPQQTVLSSCPPLQARASLQCIVKPLALCLVAVGLRGERPAVS